MDYKIFIPPIAGAIIGWFTNYVAIKMLFRPYRPVNLLGYKLQGLIPKRRKEIAAGIAKTNTKPVFVSIGHKIDLQTSIKVIQQCTKNYRIPEPIRLAHNLVNRLRNKSSVVSHQHSEIADS